MSERLPDDAVRHKPGCEAPIVTAYTGKRGDKMASCRTCRAWAPAEPPAPVDPAHVGARPDPVARDVDMPALLTLAERIGVPVLRFRHGEPEVLRTVADLGGDAA